MTDQEPDTLVMLGQVGVLLIVASGAFVLVGSAVGSVVAGVVGVLLVVGSVAVPVGAAIALAVLRAKQMDMSGEEQAGRQRVRVMERRQVRVRPRQDDDMFTRRDGGDDRWR
ncbi:MAG: hypothetical protein SVU32_03725 [Candidatus Nanohaloarchaea archaeon]|nr:hypothetical protein [Candidatus Nanohaloarchaea archaeon]